jgi:WD40 repeat protein/DNA-binding winged helix-turn-helix (wHTH) protein
MNGKTELFYEFAGFRLDVAKRILIHQGEPVALAPKVFDTLLFLVQNSGRILEKNELMRSLWPDSFVEEGNLSQNIFVLRKILGNDQNGNHLIQTIPRRGYRFVATVKQIDASAPENGHLGSPQSSLVADYWNCHSPFRSLQVFEPEDAWLFFGRDSETGELLERLAHSPLLAVVGNSGSGKSSLIRAGLIPALRAGRFCHEGMAMKSWRIALFRPAGAPFDYLAEVLASQLAPELSLKEQAEFISDCRNEVPFDKDALRNAITALINVAVPREEAGQVHVLLVADQFEELFTLTSKRETRDRYIDALLAASRPGGAIAVHLVLALRADFYAQCLEHAELSRCLQTNQYNVPRMSREQLRESVERRLQLAASRAEPGLIDSLLEEVSTEPGNLALLEHTLGQLWNKCGGYSCTLTNQAYAEIGRLRGALGRHADEVYSSLGDDRLKGLAQKIFLELVHLGEDTGTGNSNDTRRRVSKTDLLSLGDMEEVEQLLARLASSRLISTGGSEQETFVEVSHEALIREWSTLREWIAQNREELQLERRLGQAAQEWESLNRDPGALLQGARLAQGEDWLVSHPAQSPLREFLQVSVAAHAEAEAQEFHKQKVAATRLRWLSGALGVALLAALAVAWLAYKQQRIERSQRFVAQSSNLLARDHGQALDLALRSWQTARTEETHLALAKAFPELLATLNHGNPVVRAMFSPDGKRIVSVGGVHGARLWDAGGRPIATLQSGTDEIEDVAFSSNSEQLATVSSDQRVRIWKTEDGSLLATLGVSAPKTILFEATVAGRVAFSPDGTRIVTAGWDNTAKIWSAEDRRLIAILQGHDGIVADVGFSPNGKHVITASWDHTARIWSSGGQLETILTGHTQIVFRAEFSPDSQQIITTSKDRTARIWKSVDGSLLAILPHDGSVVDGVFGPNGKQIITTSDDHKARLWSSATGQPLFTLQHDGPVRRAQFSCDGRYIVTASNDETARVWNTADGRLLALLEGHSDVVSDAAFTPDGHSIVTASGDGTLRIWNTASGVVVAGLRGHRGHVTHAAFSADGKDVITNSNDGTSRVWSIPAGILREVLHGSGSAFAHFSPDSRRIVTSSADPPGIQIWERISGKLLTTLRGHSLRIWNAAFAPDGVRIVTASADHTARVWNSTSGQLLLTLKGHTGDVYHSVFSPDGTLIVTASADHTAKLWNSFNGELIATLQGHSNKIWTATFSPDGQHIATAAFDHTARLWSSLNGRLLATLEHTDVVDAVQFSPDGRYIVTASWDHTARIWSAADGHLIAILQGHTDKLIAAAFSPDSQYIVTASADHTAKVWSVPNCNILATLNGHADQIWEATFSPDGQYIVTASLDQTARVWRLLTLGDLERILAE